MKSSNPNSDFYLIIPAFNLESYLEELLDKVSYNFTPSNIIVVDDGSTDKTASIARSHGVNLIVHPANYGKGAALKSGFKFFLETDGKWVMTIDGDMQHSPDSIPEFIKATETGKHDVIIGTRLSKLDDMPFDRRFSNLTTSKVLSLITRNNIHDSQCGFRLISRTMVEGLTELPGNRFEFETECILEWTMRDAQFGWINVPTHYHGSSSSINRVHDTLLFCKVTTRHLLRNIF